MTPDGVRRQLTDGRSSQYVILPVTLRLVPAASRTLRSPTLAESSRAREWAGRPSRSELVPCAANASSVIPAHPMRRSANGTPRTNATQRPRVIGRRLFTTHQPPGSAGRLAPDGDLGRP